MNKKLLKRKRLTDRQIEVCEFVCMGFKNKEIARVMGISLTAIGQHLWLVYKRLGLSGCKNMDKRGELIRMCNDKG